MGLMKHSVQYKLKVILNYKAMSLLYYSRSDVPISTHNSVTNFLCDFK